MNQIFTGTVGYLEDRLRGEIDYDELAKKVYANKFTVMRVFLAMTGLSVGEYVRARRLTEAGREIVSTKKKIIDIALDFGYGTPESFTKAFTRFNGFSPRECRRRKEFRAMERYDPQNTGVRMKYEVVCADWETVGYGVRFHGKSEERAEQDERFFLSTRKEQDVLRVFRREGDFDWWEILEDFDAGGYRFSVAVRPQEDPFDFRAAERKMVTENYDFRLSAPEIESVFSRFRRIAVKGFYAKFVSENREFPMDLLTGFCKTVYEGLDQYGFSPDHSRPELLRIHWTPRARISERRLELYIPVLGEPLSAKEEKGESPCASRLTGVRPDPSGG